MMQNAKRMQWLVYTKRPIPYIPISEWGCQSECFMNKEANVQQAGLLSLPMLSFAGAAHQIKS